jgi:hypothetical protein
MPPFHCLVLYFPVHSGISPVPLPQTCEKTHLYEDGCVCCCVSICKASCGFQFCHRPTSPTSDSGHGAPDCYVLPQSDKGAFCMGRHQSLFCHCSVLGTQDSSIQVHAVYNQEKPHHDPAVGFYFFILKKGKQSLKAKTLILSEAWIKTQSYDHDIFAHTSCDN